MAKRIKTNWGRTKKVRRNMAWALWRMRKKKRDYDGVLLPPASDELLIWLKGNSTDTQKTDSWAKPDAENFDIKQSNCIALNGVDEVGVTSIAHGTIVSYEGSATPSYIGTALTFTEGTFYNVTFSDGTHYRLAEGNESAYSWSDDGTRYITWTGSLDEMWARRQDTYHSNAELGYWTSDPPDGIYYPCNPDLL